MINSAVYSNLAVDVLFNSSKTIQNFKLLYHIVVKHLNLLSIVMEIPCKIEKLHIVPSI